VHRTFRALGALLLVCASHATQISDRLSWAVVNGLWPSGSITISWPTFTLNGVTVAQGSTQINIINGVVNVSLLPYKGYTVTYQLTPGPQKAYSEYWSVPNSSSPLTIQQIRTSNLPTPPLIVHLSQLQTDGAVDGDCVMWSTDAATWIAAPCIQGSGGGGSWGSITGTITNQADLSAAFAGKQSTITLGNTSQYLKGDLSLGTFPALPQNTPQSAQQFFGAYNSATGGFSSFQPVSTDLSDSTALARLGIAQTWTAKQIFTPGSVLAGFNVGPLSGSSDPSSPSNGDIYYSAGLLKFRCYENGAWVNCIGSGGGGGAWGSITGTLSAQSDLQSALNATEKIANKNANGGYVGLDSSGNATVAGVVTALEFVSSSSGGFTEEIKPVLRANIQLIHGTNTDSVPLAGDCAWFLDALDNTPKWIDHNANVTAFVSGCTPGSGTPSDAMTYNGITMTYNGITMTYN
jgi:hypothetical protein